MTNVFVITKAEPLQPEIYVGVRSTMKAAEKLIRETHPNARKEEPANDYYISFVCKKDNHVSLMFIRKEALD